MLYVIVYNNDVFHIGTKDECNTKVLENELSNYLILSLSSYTPGIKYSLSKMANFDWSKLPRSEFKNVKKYINQQDISSLIMIHYKYKLNDVIYCCGSAANQLYNIFKYRMVKGGFDEL